MYLITGMKGLALNILKLAKMQKEAAEGNVDVSWRLHLEFGPIYRMKILGTYIYIKTLVT